MSSIRVLLVDDEPELLDVSRRFLDMTDGMSIGTCDSAKEALARLQNESFDVIVSDYQMPDMDGLQLLRSLREAGNKTQFILFTGKGREDVAVTALNLGATFYLQKGGDFRAQFAELANMIRRAAETTRSAAMLRESESKFRSYIENSPEGIAVFDDAGCYVEVNRAFCAMTRYCEGELLGMCLEQLHPGLDDKEGPRSFSLLREEGTTSHDSPFVRKDGSIGHWHMDAVRLADGRFIGFHSDVTQKKEMMDQVVWRERMLEQMARQNPLGVLMIDQKDERLIYSNRRFYEVWGMPDLENEVMDHALDARQVLSRCLARTKDPEQFKAQVMKGLSATEVEGSEDEVELRDGRVLRRVFNKVRDSEGRFLGRFYLFEDITERRREEEVLRDREEIYRTFYECSGDAILILGEGRRCIAANPPAVRLFGLTNEDELYGLTIEDLSPKYQLDGRSSIDAIGVLNSSIRAEGNALFEWAHLRKDGSIFSAMVRLTVMNIGGKVVEQAIVRDISVQKALSKELEESNRTLRTILDSVGDAIFVLDLDGRIIDINRRAMEMFRISREEALTLSMADDLSAPGPADLLSERRWAKVVSGEEQFMDRCSRRPHDGSIFESEVYLQRVMIGGKPAVLCSVRNVSGRRKAEDELRQRAARLAILYEIISIGGQAPTVTALVERSLEAVMSVMEFASGGIYLVEPGGTMAELVVSRGLDAESQERVSRCQIDQPPYRQLFIEGVPIFTNDFRSIANPQRGAGGVMTVASVPLVGREGVIGCLNVGTPSQRAICEEERSLLLAIGKELGTSVERRRAQQRADREHANLTSLFDSITDMVFVLDMNGTMIEANGTAVSILGYRREELLGKNIALLHDPTHREEAMHIITAMVEGKRSACPMPVRTKDGKTLHVETLVTKGKWNGVDCLIGTTRDITSKVAAEAALRHSEEKYRLLVENAGEAVTVVQDGVFRYVNDRASEMIGYSREELLHHAIVDFACPEDREAISAGHLSRQGGDGAPLRHMVRVMGRDDAIKWFDVKAARIDWEGRPATLNFYSDMTERLRNEEAMRQANRQLNLMSSITRHDILNSITVMLGLLELARRDEAEQAPEMRASLEKMRQHTRLIQSHVEFTRIYQDIGSQAPQWQDLAGMLARQRLPQELQMQVHCEGVQVLADPMLEKVFQNLLDNTTRHGMKATTVRVSCRMAAMGMDIVYEDDGIGVPADEKEHIFDYGHGRNNGLGLFLVREILSITQMRICENGADGKGARFEIHAPKGTYRRPGHSRESRF